MNKILVVDYIRANSSNAITTLRQIPTGNCWDFCLKVYRTSDIKSLLLRQTPSQGGVLLCLDFEVVLIYNKVK